MKKKTNQIVFPVLLSLNDVAVASWLSAAGAALNRQMWRCPAGDVTLHFALPHVCERIATDADPHFFEIMIEMLVDQGVLMSSLEVDKVLWSTSDSLVDAIVTILPAGSAMVDIPPPTRPFDPSPPSRHPPAAAVAVAA